MKSIVKPHARNTTTKKVASKVQGITAKQNKGVPAVWTERLQTVADKREHQAATPSPIPQSVDRREIQLNRNNDAYWQSRGFTERPADWQTKKPGSLHAQPAKPKGR